MGAQICKCETAALRKEFEVEEVTTGLSTSVLGGECQSTVARPTKLPSIVGRLSDTQKIECKEAFARFATMATTPAQHSVPASCTGQGTIMTKEFRTVLNSLGHSPVDEELEELLESAGVCGSDTIDFPTFLCMMAQLLDEEEDTLKTERQVVSKSQLQRKMRSQPSMDPDVQELIAHFQAFDTDRTGFISRAQMSRVLVAFGDGLERSKSYFEEKVASDDRINYRELVKTFRSG